MTVMKVFSAKLRKMREEKNLSQAQLAEKLNVSRGAISYYENGDRVPDIEFLSKVSMYFGVTCDELIRGVPTEQLDIHKATGLVQPAIEQLKSLNKAHLVDVLNYLLVYTPDIFKKIFYFSNVDLEEHLNVTEISGKYSFKVPWSDDVFDGYRIYGNDLQNVFGLGILRDLGELHEVVTQHKKAFIEQHRDAFDKQYKNTFNELDAVELDALYAKFVVEKWEELLNEQKE